MSESLHCWWKLLSWNSRKYLYGNTNNLNINIIFSAIVLHCFSLSQTFLRRQRVYLSVLRGFSFIVGYIFGWHQFTSFATFFLYLSLTITPWIYPFVVLEFSTRSVQKEHLPGKSYLRAQTNQNKRLSV